MAVSEQSSLVERVPGQGAESGSAGELAEADRLIADLAALLDAGLVVVHGRVLGPARYGVACDLDDAG
jgi:hypothetical protein